MPDPLTLPGPELPDHRVGVIVVNRGTGANLAALSRRAVPEIAPSAGESACEIGLKLGVLGEVVDTGADEVWWRPGDGTSDGPYLLKGRGEDAAPRPWQEGGVSRRFRPGGGRMERGGVRVFAGVVLCRRADCGWWPPRLEPVWSAVGLRPSLSGVGRGSRAGGCSGGGRA